MAVAHQMHAGTRRLFYGISTALHVVLAVVVAVLALWAGDRFNYRADLSSSESNSLSSRSVKLLHGLDQNVSLTGIYSTALKELRPHAEKHRARVADLLDLYETAGRGRISTRMIDPAKDRSAITELLRRLAEKPAFKDEAKKHADVIDKFPALNARIQQLLKSESEQLQGLYESDRKLGRVPEFGIIFRNLKLTEQDASQTAAEVGQLTADEIPRYGRAVEVVRDYLTKTQTTLTDAQGWLTGDGAKAAGESPQAGQFFAGATERYEPVLAAIKSTLEDTNDLKRVKLEDAYETLKRGDNVLVESDNEAVVLSEEDVWPFRADDASRSADGDPREFAGERAISSAILQLTQKQKIAVVFVRFRGEPLLKPDFSNFNPMMQQLPRAPFGALNELLDKENFITQEWDVSQAAAPPPVEGASKTVYVVFPPSPAPQPNPMQPSPQGGMSPEQRQAVIKAVNDSGMAMFLAGWAQPASQFAPSGSYEYADYLRSTWGVDLQYRFLALQFAPNPQQPGKWAPANRNPFLIDNDVLRFTPHEITEPLAALPGAMFQAAPIQIIEAESRPAGVKVDPIVEVRSSEDVWAFDDVMRVQRDLRENFGTRRGEGDIASPFPLAVAAVDEQNGRKAVIFASERFAADEVVRMSSLVLSGAGIQAVQLYPANADLFINALHWLTGDAARIAVGPRLADVPRLDKLQPGPLYSFLQLFLVGILPGLALLAGAGVWLMRRR